MLTDIHRNTAAFTSNTFYATTPRPKARAVVLPGLAALVVMVPPQDIRCLAARGTGSNLRMGSGGEEEMI